MRTVGGDKRCGARLQTCRVAIPGDMSYRGMAVDPKNTSNPQKNLSLNQGTCHRPAAGCNPNTENKDIIGWHHDEASKMAQILPYSAKGGMHLLGPYATCCGRTSNSLPRADGTVPDRLVRRSEAGSRTAVHAPLNIGD